MIGRMRGVLGGKTLHVLLVDTAIYTADRRQPAKHGKPSPVLPVDTGGTGRAMDVGGAVARGGRMFANAAGGPR